jgi:hypothetical protein
MTEVARPLIKIEIQWYGYHGRGSETIIFMEVAKK